MVTDLVRGRVRTLLRVAWVLAALLAVPAADLIAGGVGHLRPPAVPLVACDPYFSIWSPADRLTDAETIHWTGKPHRLTSLVRIDDKTYRVLGTEPADLPALPQVRTEVFPTRTVCTFEGEGVRLRLTFLTPALPDDLEVYSRPVTYVVWEAQRLGPQDHAVQVYFDAGPEIAVNTPDQPVEWADKSLRNLMVLRVGTRAQPVLEKKGDNLRIDWGYFHIAAVKTDGPATAFGNGPALRRQFANQGWLTAEPGETDAGPRPAQSAPVLAVSINLGRVSEEPTVRPVILAYDDEFSIQYLEQNLRPYWRRQGATAAQLLEQSALEFDRLRARCERFDAELMADLVKAGGEEYAAICALAYRQCVAGNKLVVDARGRPLMFPKENFSNGCIGTVDVLYPMAPQFLLLSPALTRAMLTPILDYAGSDRWKFPFAPHDLGTYPHANGQVYGGGERSEEKQMPVEETANLLILVAALATVEGHAGFADPYWAMLERWASYLKEKGFDPERQLCTDDFAGHLAHNVNLSAKAICGLGAFARLCELRGDQVRAREFLALARDWAARWAKDADDGDHYRLAFDQPGTWSQKYNLVWDRLLGLNLFPESVFRKEMDFYRGLQNAYGLPLDNRKDYTKLDWILWTATLTRDRGDFAALTGPVYRFLHESPSRVPMTDWYDTKTGRMVGFRARPVVGGVFLQMLYAEEIRGKWAARAGGQTPGGLESLAVPAMYWGDTSRLGRPFAKDPSVIHFQGRHWLYYSMPPFGDGRTNDGWAVGIATSTNLVDWRKVGEVLPAQECDRKGLAAPCAIVIEDKVHLFYQTYGNGPRDAICHAVSRDGTHFERDPSNPVFRPTGDWNNGRAIDAEVFPVGDRLLLYFATRDPAGRIQMLGVAGADLKSDYSRAAWTQLCDGPILRPELPWEQQCIEAPSVCRRGEVLYMFYAGAYNNAPQQIGVATSRDGLKWTRLLTSPFLPHGKPGTWNASESGHPGVYVAPNGETHLFYQGNNDRGRTWYLSRVKLDWTERGPVLAGE